MSKFQVLNDLKLSKRGKNEICIHNRSAQVNLDKLLDTNNFISTPNYYLTLRKRVHLLSF